MPLPTQLAPGGVEGFTPGGPLDPRYDPDAYGVGFFAAIAISADDVELDLAGHTIEQSDQHALLQRFFAVIELADRPFVPGQGPHTFGETIDAAERVTIHGGTIGRSAHHGIHGNGNADVIIRDVDFVDYEVGAIALNGVDGLLVEDVSAVNRKDVPVLGTFSSARFIAPYVDHLVRAGSTTTLMVDGVEHDAARIRAELRAAIDAAHHDLIVAPAPADVRRRIDERAHPIAYALFHNPSGLIDGNSYSFLVNRIGVAINGFPTAADREASRPSRDVELRDVRVIDQRADVTEVVALAAGDAAIIDLVGAVFQIHNAHPDTGRPITISDRDHAAARYVGNPVANAQALVAKAAIAGGFEGSHLDVSRSNMPATVLAWVEGAPGWETLADLELGYLCNGDSMFHVNKGAIGFKMDAAEDVRLIDTEVIGLENIGRGGSTLCGDYRHGSSHPLATLDGYGGASARGYTFAGSSDVMVERAQARDIHSAHGPAIGFDVMTDTVDVPLIDAVVDGIVAGDQIGGGIPGSPTALAQAIGVRISPLASSVRVERPCVGRLTGADGSLSLEGPGIAMVLDEGCRIASR